MNLELLPGQESRLVGDWGEEWWYPLNTAKFEEDTRLAALGLLMMTEDWVGEPPQAPSAPMLSVPENDFFADPPRPGHVYGWDRVPALAPFVTAPIPLDLSLPVGAGPSPIFALSPWWDALCLSSGEPDQPLARYAGSSAWFRRVVDNDWSWDRIPGERTASELRVYDDHLEVQEWLSRTQQTRSGPGLVGSMAPGYAEVREGIALASRSTSHASVGSRIRFEWISAIRAKCTANTWAPLIGKAEKQLVKSRDMEPHTIGRSMSKYPTGGALTRFNWMAAHCLLMMKMLH